MQVSSVAKGQKKSNKEIRKPKQEKPKAPVTSGKDFLSPPPKAKSK